MAVARIATNQNITPTRAASNAFCDRASRRRSAQRGHQDAMQ